jgi:hypothetical protein
MIFHFLNHVSVCVEDLLDNCEQAISSVHLGQYTIEQIQPQHDGSPSNIKVKVRLNRHGIFDMTHAALVESIDESTGNNGCFTLE